MAVPKTVLITGCSEGGIGEALALEFQAQGLHVFATARSETKISDSLKQLPNVTVLPLDVTSKESIAAAVAAVSGSATGGGGKLDYLVNNAGMQCVMPVLDFDIQQAKDMFEVNVWGLLAVTQAFAPLVVAAKGTIVNMSSCGALLWMPYKAIYNSSKSAVASISEGLRVELKPFGVNVVTVMVGAVETRMFDNAPQHHLPPDSLYRPAAKEIGDWATGRDMKGQSGKREDFARTLVKDILGGASGRAYCGNMSTMLRIVTSILPDFIIPINQGDWDALNRTVSGNLISTIPLAAPCHTTLYGQPNALFSEAECDTLRGTWYTPQPYLSSPSSPMAYAFTNNSCNPFLDPEVPCEIGYHVVYSVNATSAQHVQAAIRFATDHNIRLVIRNTGHDYLGKSTGAHALEIWTRWMKATELIEKYQDQGSSADGYSYAGPAIRLGAGIQTIEAYTFADSHGLMIVGGNCPTVGFTGGYIQGGGHGPLASKYGLATDQVLEWEVVTGTGEILTANAREHPDLFWALRGGGGSTYGVVLSVTVKAFPDTFVASAYLTVPNNGTNEDAVYSAIGSIFQTLPALADAGAIAIWTAQPAGFVMAPAAAPGLHAAELDGILQPAIDALDVLGLDYTYASLENSTFLQYFSSSVSASASVADYNIGGRLVARSLVENNLTALVDAVRFISSQAGLGGNVFNVKGNGVASPDDVAANPYFREAIWTSTVGTPINYTDWNITKANQDQLTRDLIPALAALTPGSGGGGGGGGAYLNEADPQEPNFQSVFYGDHYARLLEIKRKYDPDDIFYAKTAVGSDRWKEDIVGRLCMS
ncbi:putative secondary metabolism biosynthetic enzyme [Diatrype stigma]|uniref:Secondary metabolism biosynthetic enzyme n=1 Tax=Diatrype stigma TaxID=117547 RepID=A0AAN9UYN4_9PEZI